MACVSFVKRASLLRIEPDFLNHQLIARFVEVDVHPERTAAGDHIADAVLRVTFVRALMHLAEGLRLVAREKILHNADRLAFAVHVFVVEHPYLDRLIEVSAECGGIAGTDSAGNII